MPTTARLVKAAVLALALLAAGALVALNFTDLRLLGEESGHEHGSHHHDGDGGFTQGSPAYNGRNVSFLESGGGVRDSILTVCDRTGDGIGAEARAYNSETRSYTYAFDTGANNGDCDTTVTRRNHESHQTSRGGSYAGGETSLHR